MNSSIIIKRIRILKALAAIAVIIIFGAVAAIAILFAQGRTLSDSGPIQTSIIKINSVPKDTEVYLDDTKVTLNDSKIEWIQPGIRNLRLVKQGYKSWENSIKVEPGVVKEVFAQLYPEKLDFVKLTQTNIDKIVFSENREFVYYTVIDESLPSEQGLWKLKLSRNLFDFGSNTPSLISDLSEFRDNLKSGYSLSISSDNNRVLLNIPEKNVLEVFEVNRLNQSIDIYSILGFYPDSVVWFRGSESLVVKEDNLLFELEISTGHRSIVDYSKNDELMYSINYDFVYIYRKNQNNIYKYKNRSETLVKLPSTIDLKDLMSIYSIRGLEDTLILKYPNKMIYINEDKDFIETINNVDEIIRIADNARVILFVRDEKVYTYSLENTVDNLSFVSQQNPVDISLDDIENLQFTPNNRSIIYLQKPNEQKTSQASDIENSQTAVEEDMVLSARTISVIDIDGKNNLEIFKDARIEPNTPINISGDSVNMYILINEETSQGVFAKNIFKFDLEGSN